MLVCENCKEKHNGLYGSGRFCSIKCARNFSTKNETKKYKKSICPSCKNEIKIDKRAVTNKTRCLKCQKEYRREYNKSRKSPCKSCGQLECKRSDICKKYHLFFSLSKYFGFNESYIGTSKVYEEFERIKNILIEEYHDKKLSLPDISNKHGYYDVRNLGKIFDSLGIERRSLSEANKQACLNGKNNGYDKNFQCGYHTSWNNKTFFLRSSYEFDFAKELDKQKINYEVEKLRILYWDSNLNRQRIAIPDFYLPDSNTIIEVKSEYISNLQKNIHDKVKAYKEHGYKVRLILDKKEQLI